MKADNYNPYPYNPMSQYFYNAPHEGAVNQFAAWLKGVNPNAYNAVARANPSLFDGQRAVRSGSLSGMGFVIADDSELVGAGVPQSTSPITQWGNQLLDLAKGYMAYDMQRDLLQVNLARAEKGLPPISSSSLAPTLNMGISPDVQRLGFIAVGGLVLVGLFSAFKRGSATPARRRRRRS